MDANRLDQLSRTLSTNGTRRGVLLLVTALLAGLASATGRESAWATEHPRHPGHKLRQRTGHRRRKHRHDQQLDDQEDRQDEQEERQDDRRDGDDPGDDNGPGDGLGSTGPDCLQSRGGGLLWLRL